MKKIKIMLVSLFIASTSFAQITLEEPKKSTVGSLTYEQLNMAINVSKNRGLFVGSAAYCKFDMQDILLIKRQFLTYLSKVQMSTEDRNTISNSFDKSVEASLKDGPNQTTCSAFKAEFDKVIVAIKSNKIISN